MKRKVLWMVLSLAILPAAAWAGVTGRVTDGDGARVAGAAVRLETPAGEVLARTETGADGRFELPASEAGELFLVVEARGFETWSDRLFLQGSAAVEVRLAVAGFRQEIVVRGALPELSGEVALTGAELDRRGAQDLAGSLRDEAGLSAVRRGPINFDPTLRGLQETQVGMFVDGTRTFAAGPGRMDSELSHVSPHSAETVTVVKGPYALSWGSGTLSAIDVTTFAPAFGAGALDLDGRAGLGYGEGTGALDAFGGVWGASERLTFSLLHNRRQGDDYEDGAGRLVPADYRSDDSRWSFGRRLGEATELAYRGGYQHQRDLDYAGRQLDATYFYTRSHSLELQRVPGSGPFDELFAQVYVNRKDHAMNNDEKPTALPIPGRPFGLDVLTVTESNTAGGRASAGWARGDWRFKIGGDAYRVEQNATRSMSRRTDGALLFADVIWPDARRDSLGTYGQAIYSGDGYEVGATVRADRIESTAGPATDFFLANTTGDLDQQDTELSAAVSGRFRAGDRWVLTAGLGRAVRPPDALERYSDRIPATKLQVSAEMLGNPELEPEASLELDAGAEARWGSLLLDVDLFWRRIDDYVTVLPDPTLPRRLPMSPPVVFRFVNGDRAVFRGGELRLSHAVTDLVSWWSSLGYTWAEDETFGEPAMGIAPLTARAGLRLTSAARPWWTEAALTWADDQDRVAARRFETPTPGYAVLDLRAGYRFARGLEARVGIDNLTDRQYVHHLNSKNPFTGARIAEPGRSVYAGIDVRF